MSVNEVRQALGSWSVVLSYDTPREILDRIQAFSHVAIVPGRVDPVSVGDNILTTARYVGVFRERDAKPSGYQMSGAGMAFWLGDEDGKGHVMVNATTVASATFANAVRAILPPSVAEGTLYSIPGSGTFSNVFQFTDPRTALTYITDTYSTDTFPVGWRVNGNATVDAGRDVDLYGATPKALLVNSKVADGGYDLDMRGFSADLGMGWDVTDYTTRVVLLAEGDGASTVTASAAQVTSFRDLRGNLVNLTRLVSEFETDGSNAQARAQLQLNRFTNPRFAVDLSTADYDVRGTFGVGDRIWVYDPDIGFTDGATEVPWRGRVLNPKALQVSEMTWPVPENWTVAFRLQDGTWLDVSDYYVPESGATSVVVGDYNRALTDAGGQPIGSRPIPDASVPAAPAFSASTTSSYLASATGNGETRAQVQLTWNQPTNTDGSTVTDGHHYEIRYIPTSASATLSYNYTSVGWGTNSVLITDLMNAREYNFAVRAVDSASPPNAGAWSTTWTVLTSVDTTAPSTPAAPTLASSLIAIQVTHTLGQSGGGTYNLEYDLDHLEVHFGTSSSFTPDATTRVGKVAATAGNLRALVPAIATFGASATNAVWCKVIAVDGSGNRSNASTAASSTATLIDNAHISDLTVSKVTAGTIAATWIQGGTLTTASTGARVELAGSGLNAYNSSGTKTVEIKGSDGSATITGVFKTGFSGGGSPYLLIQDSSDRTTLYFYNSNQTKYAFINSPGGTGGGNPGLGMNTGSYTMNGQTVTSRIYMDGGNGIELAHINGSSQYTGGRIWLYGTGSYLAFYGASNVQTGGYVFVDTDGAVLLRNGSGTPNGGAVHALGSSLFLSAYNTGAVNGRLEIDDSERFWFQGKIPQDSAISGKAMVFAGQWATSGSNVYTVNYGTTMSTTPYPLWTVSRGNTTAYSWHGHAFSTTSLAVWVDSTTTFTFTYWAYRLA